MNLINDVIFLAAYSTLDKDRVVFLLLFVLQLRSLGGDSLETRFDGLYRTTRTTCLTLKEEQTSLFM